ncbi:hypothetical protein [Virgibacillus sp. CBA3643]|uniref:hypothetical protein n=1 Tax=Virgibacillus sp. CBA3643 TaxID=2942278 RepID=UPI0035A271F6
MNKKKIFAYVLWLYGLSFGIAALFFLSGLGNNMLFLSLFMTGYMFFPLISVFIVKNGSTKRRSLVRYYLRDDLIGGGQSP